MEERGDFHDRSTLAVVQSGTDEQTQILATGFMVKRGRIIPSWNRRYFELTSNRLDYFSDDSKNDRKGSLTLNAEMVVRDCNFRHFCFCVFQPGNSKRADIMYALFRFELT